MQGKIMKIKKMICNYFFWKNKRCVKNDDFKIIIIS